MATSTQDAFQQRARSHFCCSIVPPDILKHVSEHGDTFESRDIALKTLHHIAVIHDARVNFQGNSSEPPTDSPPHTIMQPAISGRQLYRMLYDSHQSSEAAQLLFIEGHVPQHPPDDQSASNVYAQFKQIYDFYYDVFGRDSIDNRGLKLVGKVHFDDDNGRTPGYDNAFWAPTRTEMAFGDGDNKMFGSFANNLGITSHELTHGVIQYTAGLPYAYQAGALNESIADVFGSMVKQYYARQEASDADWLIGEGLLLVEGARALRDLASPGTAYDNPKIGKDPQVATMDDFKITTNDLYGDFGGVHINSGIPNRAFYLAATLIGGFSWDVAGKVWYDSLMDPGLQNIDPRTAFKTFADLTCKHAEARGPKVLAAVKKAWINVKVFKASQGI